MQTFVPALYDASVVDEVIGVPDEEAIRTGRELASTEGLLAGISSGAVVYAARLLAERPEFNGQNHRRLATRYGRTLSFDRALCLRCLSNRLIPYTYIL